MSGCTASEQERKESVRKAKAAEKKQKLIARPAVVHTDKPRRPLKEPKLTPQEQTRRKQRREKHEEMLKKQGKSPSEMRAEREHARHTQMNHARAARCTVCKMLVRDLWARLEPQQEREADEFVEELADTETACSDSDRFDALHDASPEVSKLACYMVLEEHGEAIGQAMFLGRFRQLPEIEKHACDPLLECEAEEDRNEL